MKRSRFGMLLAAVLVCALLSGCMSVRTDVTFEEDGTGSLTYGFFMADSLLELMGEDDAPRFDEADGPVLHKTIDGEPYTGQEISVRFSDAEELNAALADDEEEKAPSMTTVFRRSTLDGAACVTMECTVASDGELAGEAAADEEAFAPDLSGLLRVGITLTFPGGIVNVEGLRASDYTVKGNSIEIDLVSTSAQRSFSVTGRLSAAKEERTFAPVRTYDDPFTDVPADAWYGRQLKAAYESGIINGATATTFNPAGPLTRAQVVVMAARLRSQYMGDGETFAKKSEADPWFRPYADYAAANGIIDGELFAVDGRNVTRGEMAYVFANCLPDERYAPKHEAPTFGDVSGVYSAEIGKLYRAGVVNGVSDTAFNPDGMLTRAQAAVFVGRLIDRDLRV